MPRTDHLPGQRELRESKVRRDGFDGPQTLAPGLEAADDVRATTPPRQSQDA